MTLEIRGFDISALLCYYESACRKRLHYIMEKRLLSSAFLSLREFVLLTISGCVFLFCQAEFPAASGGDRNLQGFAFLLEMDIRDKRTEPPRCFNGSGRCTTSESGLGISGELRKYSAIRGALRGGLINCLTMQQGTTQQIVQVAVLTNEPGHRSKQVCQYA